MMKMSRLSYNQRLFDGKPVECGNYVPTYEVFAVETYADKGRVLKRSVVKVQDNSEIMSMYCPDDFRIENLAAVGALQDNKRYTYNPSAMEMMDSVNDAFDVLTDIVDNNVNNEVENG